MPTATTKKLNVTLLLNNGSTSTGAIRTTSMKLGGSSQDISSTNYNADLSTSRTKAIAIATAISPCLEKSLLELDEVTTSMLSN